MGILEVSLHVALGNGQTHLHQKIISLKGKVRGRKKDKRKTQEIFDLLAHSSDGPSDQGWPC